mgnify:CR=1 FL=1
MGAKLVAITPKGKVVNNTAFLKEYASAMTDTGKGMKADFESTTRTWKRKPKFTISKPKRSGGAYEIFVGTDNLIYLFVDEGTKRHLIRPKKRGGVLRFKTGYVARTIPRVLHSGGGGSGSSWASAKVVRHPGTKPRRFSFIIQLKWQDSFERRMRAATEKAAKVN